MNTLEIYLRRATRGVWGKKRLELIAELRGSLEARIWMLECQGYAPERALEVALSELGEPREPRAIAAGLIGVHTMPRIFRSTLALGLFAALSVTLINSSRAQIEVIGGDDVIFIASPGFTIKITGSIGVYYLKFSSIEKNLTDAGIAVESLQSPSLEASQVRRPVPTLRFELPGSTRETVLQATPITGDTITLATLQSEQLKNGSSGVLNQPATNVPDEDSAYISFSDFVWQLKERSGLPVRIVGWKNPIIEIGSTKLQIGTTTNTATPREVFAAAAGRAVQSGFPQVNGWLNLSGSYQHVFKSVDPAGTVYAVVTSAPSTKTMQSIDAARVADDGVLYFRSAFKTLEFVRTPLELIRDRANIGERGYGSSSRPAKALLVRITPDLKTSFVLPARVRSGAIK